MKRIKEFKYLLLPLVVAVLIFFIPFSWLKPGEMDLGGIIVGSIFMTRLRT